MCLKNKIISFALCAIVAVTGVFVAGGNTAHANPPQTVDPTIEELQQMVNSLLAQIQQIIALIARLKPLETCGNGICRLGETAATCPADCAMAVCAKKYERIPLGSTKKCCTGLIKQNEYQESPPCASPETCINSQNAPIGYFCDAPAVCGDKSCETTKGETAAGCAADCGTVSVCGRADLLPTDTARCTAAGGIMSCPNAGCATSAGGSNCIGTKCTCNCTSSCTKENERFAADASGKCCSGLTPVSNCAGSSSGSCQAAYYTCQKLRCQEIANLGGYLKHAPSIYKHNDKLYIAGTGGDNALWVYEYSVADKSKNVPWYSLDGSLSSGPAMEGVGSSLGTWVTVYAIGSDNQVWQRSRGKDSSPWSAWELSSNTSTRTPVNFKAGPGISIWSASESDPYFKYEYKVSLDGNNGAILSACERELNVPDSCYGKSCQVNGSGQQGQCCAGYACAATGSGLTGTCLPLAQPACGNGKCEANESPNNCLLDCGTPSLM